MDFQIYDVSTSEGRKQLPTVKYTIQIIAIKKDLNTDNFSEKFTKFLKAIRIGDLILLEYPIIIEGKGSSYGIRSFFIKISNYRTGRLVKLPGGRMELDFWNNLEKIKIFE